MFGIKPLINTDTCIFNPPPPGKPNPTFFYDGKTPRERVAQEAQKGIDCWYTVMGWLEPPVGVFHAKKFELLKSRQALIKDRCDVLRDIKKSLESLNAIYLDLKIDHNFQQLDKEKAKNLLEGKLVKLESDTGARAREALQDFLKQNLTDDFKQFIIGEYQRKCNRCEELFLFDALHSTGKFSEENLRHCIVDIYKKGPMKYWEKEWEDLSLFEKMWTLREMSTMTCAALCDFNRSTWNPRKKVTDLIQEIKNNGPLMVQGYFGRPIYKSNPVEIEKVAGRSIWECAGKIQVKRLNQFHPILIVGARSDTRTGHVYFVDALDRSDPFDLLNPPPVYAMSYLMLQEGIASVNGVKIPLDAIKESTDNYAWSAKKFKGYI